MARPKHDGLLYFSFDTDFFYADKRIKRFHSKYGNDGLIFYIYLLTEIYRSGYYISWGEEAAEDAATDLRLKEGFAEQVLAYLVSRSLLTMSKLANSVTVITSPGIQKRYQEAVKGRKRQIEVDSEIWLLSKEETASCIKVTQNVSNSGKNQSDSGKNQSNSGKNRIKESKGKESKGKEIPRVERFEDFWTAYPNKQRRYLAETAYCALVTSGTVTEDDLVLSAGNYARHVKESGDRMYMPNNWLEKCAFEDYLPGKHAGPGHGNASPGRDSGNQDGEEEELVGDDWMDCGSGP